MRLYTRKTLEERFWPKVAKGDSAECWDWLGATVHGYGYLGRVPASPLSPEIPIIRAPRVSWKIHHGELPPEGMCICHHCDRPICVNPAHLFLGTIGDNNRDRHAKRRDGERYLANHKAGEESLNAKVSLRQVQEIRARYATGEVTQTALAKEYGISQPQVSRIVLGTSWVT